MAYAISCNIQDSHDSPGDFLYGNYTEFFRRNGLELLLISNFAENLKDTFEKFKIEGLILSGGNDILSAPVRDMQEKRMLDIAVMHKLPVLGICRGMQFINYYFGGKAPQDLAKTVAKPALHVSPSHKVKITGTKLKELIGNSSVSTNSFHKQGLTEKQISQELEVLAVSEADGVVEAVSHKAHPIVGIQWHPERKSPDDHVNSAILESFKNRSHYWGAR